MQVLSSVVDVGEPSRRSDQQEEGVDLTDRMEDIIDGLDDVEDIELDADADLDGPQTAGRISNENRQILRDTFNLMYDKIKEVAAVTGQARSQVLDQFFTATHTRVHLKTNAWNIYSAYFAANREQEIELLPDAECTCIVCCAYI